jgi:hypothetical protein
MRDHVIERSALGSALKLHAVGDGARQPLRLAARQHGQQVGCADLAFEVGTGGSARRRTGCVHHHASSTVTRPILPHAPVQVESEPDAAGIEGTQGTGHGALETLVASIRIPGTPIYHKMKA